MNTSKAISRRKFIGLAFIVIVGILVVFFAVLPFKYIAKRILKKDLEQLKINDEIFDKFISDALANKYFSGYSLRKKWLIRIYDAIQFSGSLPYAMQYREYRSQLVADFLMSTDFFTNGMDESMEIGYIGFYDPYLRPCSNPFSNLFYSRL